MPQINETKTKARRRGNNEGSIYFRKDMECWYALVTIGYKPDGKPIREAVRGETRQAVAKQVANLTSRVFKSGYTSTSSRDDTNFQVLLKEWYEVFKAQSVECVTDEKFRSMLKKHIFPAFGALDIKDVDTMRLQRFFNQKRTAKVKDRIGYSSDFIGKMKNLLNNFFEYAVEENIITVNPILKVKITPNRREENAYNEKKGQALHPEIRKAVLEWVEENPVLKPILILCTLRGLRPQEVITLKWENVNFNSKKLNIKTALNRVVEFDEDWNVVSRGAVRGKTKTPKSNRTITMPITVIAALQEWKHYCHSKELQSEFVFPNTKTGEMRTYAGLRSLFRRFMEKHDLQGMGTLYTLRHTFATILLEQRENPKIVMELMGHTKVKTTLDLYSHVVDDSVYEQTDQTLDDYYIALTNKNSPNAEAM